jgi:hypothetical protein
MNEEYIRGFKLGQSLGEEIGKLKGIVSICIYKTTGFIFLCGVTLGYLVGKFLR